MHVIYCPNLLSVELTLQDFALPGWNKLETSAMLNTYFLYKELVQGRRETCVVAESE